MSEINRHDGPEYALIRNPVRRLRSSVPVDAPSAGDRELIEAVDRHITNWIGPVEVVYHEISSPYVHIDVHHVPPAADRPFHALVTSGMSEMPMSTPDGAEEFRYSELLVLLPTDWPISQEAFEDEQHYWPVRWLKRLARFPHEYGTWLGWGHTAPNGNPPEPFASGTAFCGMLLLPPLSLSDEAAALELADGRVVRFWALVPLYAEELALKLEKGTGALLALFDQHGVTDLLDTTRPNVAARRPHWWSR